MRQNHINNCNKGLEILSRQLEKVQIQIEISDAIQNDENMN